ncbi:metallophosphoesterase [Pyrus ussuriensis x Pyrus communis]|uniref:Metallophosphoesterase n=1 Tax=Pyrus ussuriensis x Pyrus communis TaxID=2448454 RepID=A0A5N5H1U0_9ROSA|nr:metallophosphoesterase [Pyrus ussuriensis x Pyrus communis]
MGTFLLAKFSFSNSCLPPAVTIRPNRVALRLELLPLMPSCPPLSGIPPVSKARAILHRYAKSKDLLTMKQNEDEWLEYHTVMQDVIKRSRLDKTLFFDLRGNQDNFGVPQLGGSFDFFSKYSTSGHLGRSRNVNSVTLQTADRKHLFVGVDSTMPVGLRGPTNLFAHPTDQLLAQLDTHLSQWDSRSQEPLSKISFGHFPLSFSQWDSRFMSTSSTHHDYECHDMVPLSYGTVRALVFSVSPIASVTTKIYDSRPGFLNLVFEAPMHMIGDNTSRGDHFVTPWNHRAFEDPVPNRYWLQIEATDLMGRSTLSDLRPFSVNGFTTTISWTWKEFMVMGCQWAALYYPMLWCAVYFIPSVLLIPQAILIFSVRHFTYKNKGFVNAIGLVFQELCKLPVAWFGFLGYLFYLILFPWFIGQVFTDGKDEGYMTYMGWVVKSFNQNGKHKYVGSPDVMVVVLPHLVFLKEDDCGQEERRSLWYDYSGSRKSNFHVGNRRIRNVLLVLCLAVCWKHFMNCRTLVKAYEMNTVLHFPGYSLTIPLLLAYTAYKTRSV